MWSWSALFDFLTDPELLKGAWRTVWLTVISMTGGLALGLVLALMRSARWTPLNRIAGGYVWIFRGTPVLVQLIIIYTGLPQVGIKLGAVPSALIGLALNEAAYLSEIVRAGILSVPAGQSEAARALGMSPWKVLRVVVLPQAFRFMVPPLGNSFNGLLKMTSIVSFISVAELLRQTQYAYQLNYRVLEGLVAAALYYLVLTTLWGFVQSRIEAVTNRAYGGSPAKKAAVKEQEVEPAIQGEMR